MAHEEHTDPSDGAESLAFRDEVRALADRVASLERELSLLQASLPSTRRSAAPPLPAMRYAEAVTRPAADATPAPPPPPVSAGEPRPPQDFESRLGSTIFNRVGILILLLGTAFFFKLAYDRGWIVPSPTGRVIAGLIAGAGIVLWSERFRSKGFAAFSYSLKALGSSVLYLTLWAAFHLFHLLPAPVALALMLAVTAWNTWMALTQNSELLAGYALAGGFLTPLLLSTGTNHEAFLFTYLLALDLATVILVRIKGWPRLLLGAFPLTMLFFIGWYSEFYRPDELALTTVFILLFDSTFSSVALRRTPLPPGAASAFGDLVEDVLLPPANAAFLALALYSVLQDSGHHDLLPWMMIALAAVYLCFMRLPQSRTAAAIHLSIAIVCLTIAVPLKASGHWITATWLVEGLVLLWVATRVAPATGPTAARDYTSRVLQLLSTAALSLGFGGILYHLALFAAASNHTLFNADLATALTGLAVFAGAIALCLRSAAQHPEEPFWVNCSAAATIAFNLVAILTGIREIDAIWSPATATPDASLQQSLAISAFLMLYGAALLAVGFYRRSAFLRWQALLLLIVSILKAFLYDMRNLSQGYRVASFLGLGALLMAISFAYQKDWLALREPTREDTP